MYTSRVRLIFSSLRNYYTVKSNTCKQQFDLAKQLQAKIKTTGPITVAEYMREVLTNPTAGYYMHKDMFGETGDFVTSPELGQVFGEMIAIWFLNEWSKIGSPKPFQIVELGPGRGTLCQDILRVFNHFQSLKEANVSLVEVSPFLSDIQARRLCIQTDVAKESDAVVYREGKSVYGTPVKWYRNLKDVPNIFTLLIAHEFFDALPVHKFMKTDQGYREILIDIDPSKDKHFRYVIAPQETPMLKLLLKSSEKREHFETSPESLVLIKEIAFRLEQDGGLALIGDYGHNGDGTDTFRAFKKHKQQEPLLDPGTADLTADVDFHALTTAAVEDNGILAFGPVTQREFLMRMGIQQRLQKLEENATPDQVAGIKFGYEMMTDSDKMGIRFKFLALLPIVLEKIIKKVPVVGFH